MDTFLSQLLYLHLVLGRFQLPLPLALLSSAYQARRLQAKPSSRVSISLTCEQHRNHSDSMLVGARQQPREGSTQQQRFCGSSRLPHTTLSLVTASSGQDRGACKPPASNLAVSCPLPPPGQAMQATAVAAPLHPEKTCFCGASTGQHISLSPVLAAPLRTSPACWLRGYNGGYKFITPHSRPCLPSFLPIL